MAKPLSVTVEPMDPQVVIGCNRDGCRYKSTFVIRATRKGDSLRNQLTNTLYVCERELGECIAHALGVESLADKRRKAERRTARRMTKQVRNAIKASSPSKRS